MKVARLHAIGDVRLHDEPAPGPGLDEALVHVTAVGLCGSDLHWFGEAGIGDARLAKPLVLGHEFSAVTDAGRSVAVDPAIPCLECELCRKGQPNLCPAVRFAGHGENDGGLQEMLAWPTRCLVPLPEKFSAADGAMLEPLGVALHAVDLGKVQAGMRVGVFGCGPIGLLAIQVARAAGATDVLVTEPLAHRMDAAREYGAKEWTPDQSVDVALECAGEDQAVADAVTAARPGGRVILVGIPSHDQTTFPASVARRKGLTLMLSRRMRHTYPRSIRLVETGRVDVRSLVTHRFPLSRVAEAFAVAKRRDGLKVIVEPTQVGHG
jgi:L-iditol 2-dehydrogenase